MMNIILHKNREETQFLEAVHLASMFKIKLNKIIIIFFFKEEEMSGILWNFRKYFQTSSVGILDTTKEGTRGPDGPAELGAAGKQHSTRRGKEREWQWLEVALQLPPYTRADTQMQSVAGLNAVGAGLWWHHQATGYDVTEQCTVTAVPSLLSFGCRQSLAQSVSCLDSCREHLQG